MILSISSRMQIAAFAVLVGFLGVTGVMLEKAYRANLEQSMRERIKYQANALIASVDQEDKGRGVYLAYALPEARFFNPGSGLYAQIFRNDGVAVWTSPSMDGVKVHFSTRLGRAEERYETVYTSQGAPVMVYSMGVTWGENEKFKEGYTFVVGENLYRMNQEIKTFRQNLWASMAAVTVILLVMLTLILRWGLNPLRRVAEDLDNIKSGIHHELGGDYPKELRGLTDSLNNLLHANREHQERYRATLGDLAHSLKTPLAVLRGAVTSSNPSVNIMRKTVEEQVDRMDQIVHYQLQRAATSGRRALAAPISIPRIASKVVNALDKVYADKKVLRTLNIPTGLTFHCDEGDLMELLGNLVDNAYKWCKRRVEIRVQFQFRVMEDVRELGLLIRVSDDGPGIPEDKISTVLSRGGRVDPSISGHGLGMDMVRDIVELYGGYLDIDRSSLGGARIEAWLPGDSTYDDISRATTKE